MQNLYEKFKSLDINKSILSLDEAETATDYFCYPIDAKPIGFEGSIMYCFLPEYEEMVFAVNPESCADRYVYPLAENFSDFVRLLLACGNANVIEQVVWMNQKQFQQHLIEESELSTQEHKSTLSKLAEAFKITPMENPFEYIKALQNNFTDTDIKFKDEYYEILGIERRVG